MYIMGISAYYHDSAACLHQDGKTLIACQEEERFTHKKHDASFPSRAITACLEIGGKTKSDIDLVAFYDKPFLKFERILETYLTYALSGIKSFLRAMPLWIKKKLWIKELTRDELNYFLKLRKKWWLAPIIVFFGAVQPAGCSYRRISSSVIYLHIILVCCFILK